MIDVKVVGKDGVVRRVRRVAPIQNRRAAERLEHEIREQLLGADGAIPAERPAVPRFKDFAQTFLNTYARTNNKPSEIENKESILRVHLVPALGELTLDAIKAPQVEIYKSKKLAAGLA